MRSLLRSRRGSVAFATVVALIPLIGVVALGGEAGSWYVTRQHAQNAADAAAYSGAMQQLCLANLPCAVAQSMDYRAKQSAAQNGFCNAGGTSYPGSVCSASLPSGVSQTVTITPLASWNGTAGTFVQATVSQQQPAYLAAVLGLTTVTIPATAVAAVQRLAAPACVLALTGSISFQGSPNINAPNCGMASNDPAKDAINFTGGGMSMNLGSLSTVGGCTGAASFCSKALTYMPAPTVDPFTALDGALTTLCGANPTVPTKCGLPPCGGSTLVAYTAANPCTNDGLHITSNGAETLSPGGNTGCPTTASSCVYFISGTLKITGTPTISGTATFILLPGATINNQGNAVITITGPTTAPAPSASLLPAALQSNAALFQYMALYAAPCPTCSTSQNSMTFGGNTNITLNGNIYAPTANVTFQGNPTITVGGAGGGCGQLVAASIAFNGNATFNNNQCGTTSVPKSQYVQLVQ
ncbi:pilus assembly protein TadG-related protein [Bradyrhizobium sp. ma5]|uniref:pilus assembly protein TadG-related protein n=1 Tax=Bradyrhizobium sp. ma5 TaxID=3344828 RepID=UPI0035D4F768